MPGAERLRYAVGHDCLHWLTWRDAQWAGHLCAQSDASSDCHPTVRASGCSPCAASAARRERITTTTSRRAALPDDLRLLRALRITR